MSLFEFEYLNGCLFASGLAAAAVCHFRGARRRMLAASVPLFLTTLVLLCELEELDTLAAVSILFALSVMLGVTALMLGLTYDAPGERRRAWAVTFLLASPALLVPATVVFYELREFAFDALRQLVKL